MMDHKPIGPPEAVEALCDRIAAETPLGSYGSAVSAYSRVQADLNAFRATCLPLDGRRPAHAVRYVLERPDLTAEVEALLAPLPRPAEEEGTLHMQLSGRWAVCRPGRDPWEITSGELFRVEVEGMQGLQPTRMEHAHPGGYYAVAGYPLRDGLRAALGTAED
jgi:hypothetical protein